MTLANAPFEVAYPVKFYSEGDTTKDAFGKHIQEIERIYGLLNALNADKLSVDVFNNIHNAHVNSSNPHPNLYLTTLKGNLPVDRVSGNWPTSRISGNLDGSRITGDLSGATIDKGKVTGLSDFIKSQIPESTGITAGNVAQNGYVKFGNGLMLQWGTGTTDPDKTVIKIISFPVSFSQKCYGITGSTNDSAPTYMTFPSDRLSKSSFAAIAFRPGTTSSESVGNIVHVENVNFIWIAIGK